MPHLLIVDDDDAVRESLVEIGREHGYTVAQAGTVRDALIQVERQLPDLVLTDVRLPGATGMDLFSRISHAGVEVVVITGYGSMENAIEALRAGATDYLVKPICMERLEQILARVASAGQDGDWDPSQPFQQDGRFGRLVGASAPMQALYRQISRVAPTEVTTLLIGESGTGKELAAHAVHELSARRAAPSWRSTAARSRPT